MRRKGLLVLGLCLAVLAALNRLRLPASIRCLYRRGRLAAVAASVLLLAGCTTSIPVTSNATTSEPRVVITTSITVPPSSTLPSSSTSATTASMPMVPTALLDWPAGGPSAEVIVGRLKDTLGPVRPPLYLPRRLPPGFHAADYYPNKTMSGEPVPNPRFENLGQAIPAGYEVAFTDGMTTVLVRVNAGMFDDTNWPLSDIPFEGGFFRRYPDGPAFTARGAQETYVAITAPVGEFDLAEAVARELVRVE